MLARDPESSLTIDSGPNSLHTQSNFKLLISNQISKEFLKQELIPYRYSFLPRDASAERGDATVSRLSVRLSVCDV